MAKRAKRLIPILNAIEYAGFRAMTGLVRAMPLDVASNLCAFLWRHFAPLNKRHARALSHLETAFPEKSPAEREAIARTMWSNLGRVMAESFQLDRLIADPSRMQFAVDDLAAAVRETGKGSLIVSMHTGNWEICVWPMTASGFQPAGVYQKVKNPLVDAYIAKLRAPLYPGGLFSKSHDTARKLVTWVRKGGQLGVLSDQRDNKGILVPFFGKPAPSTPLPAMLAVRLGVPIVIGRVIRLNGSRFRIEGEFLDVARTGDKDADIEETTARIHRQFEEWIREYPDQWMWGHRRWRS